MYTEYVYEPWPLRLVGLNESGDRYFKAELYPFFYNSREFYVHMGRKNTSLLSSLRVNSHQTFDWKPCVLLVWQRFRWESCLPTFLKFFRSSLLKEKSRILAGFQITVFFPMWLWPGRGALVQTMGQKFDAPTGMTFPGTCPSGLDAQVHTGL